MLSIQLLLDRLDLLTARHVAEFRNETELLLLPNHRDLIPYDRKLEQMPENGKKSFKD